MCLLAYLHTSSPIGRESAVFGTTHIVECTGILRNDVQRSSQRTEGTAIDTVTVCGTVDFGSRAMDRGMDHVGGAVEQSYRTTTDDIALMVDLNQVRPLDLGEGHTERIDPESRRIHWIPNCDMSRNAFVEAIFAEDPECSGKSAL